MSDTMIAPAASRQAASMFRSNSFFGADLGVSDPDIARAVALELGRQRDEIELIASENIARATSLFGCGYANVQPNSGSQANQAVFLAVMSPGDRFMGLDLAAGGHLTHGSPVNMSGRWFHPVPYSVDRETGLVDMEAVERIAHDSKPKVIIAGGSAYSRLWDFARFRQIADAVGAVFLVDMAHFAGLVAGGVHPSPFPHAHVVTSTTHKTLRGPRGGLILTDDEALAKKINSAIFPGLQGGPPSVRRCGPSSRSTRRTSSTMRERWPNPWSRAGWPWSRGGPRITSCSSTFAPRR